MPSTIFSVPRFRQFNASGQVMPGAKLYFYVSGTSTAATTYQNSTLTTPHSNPVLADTGGLFPAIWLNNSVTYDVTLKAATGSTLWSVTALSGSAGNVLSLVSEQTGSPYTETYVEFREPDDTLKGYVGFYESAANVFHMISRKAAQMLFGTGNAAEDSYIKRLGMTGSDTVTYVDVFCNGATSLGGGVLRFIAAAANTTKAVLGFASTADNDFDITNSVSGGHIEFSTSGTGRVKFPLASGAVGTPMIAVTGDATTGLYSRGSGLLTFTSAGAQVFETGASANTNSVPVSTAAGSVAAVTFKQNGGAAGTGLYWLGTGDLGFASAGTATVGITSTGISLKDGVTAPGTLAGFAQIYVDTADGDLKVKFGDGTVKTIVTDT